METFNQSAAQLKKEPFTLISIRSLGSFKPNNIVLNLWNLKFQCFHWHLLPLTLALPSDASEDLRAKGPSTVLRVEGGVYVNSGSYSKE